MKRYLVIKLLVLMDWVLRWYANSTWYKNHYEKGYFTKGIIKSMEKQK